MIFSNVLIRSHSELVKTNNQIRHALVEEARSTEKGTYPLVYQYLGKRRSYGKEHTIEDDSVIGEITNIHQDEDCGDILCDVTINDVKKNAANFNFKIDNIVVCITNGKETIVNGVVYNPYAKSVIDQKRRVAGSYDYVRKVDPSPIPDDIAADKSKNPLFDPNVRDSVDKSLNEFLEGGDTSNDE